MLFDASMVEGFLILVGIVQVCLIVGCEIMIARKIALGTHIDETVRLTAQNGIDCAFLGQPDGTGGQAVHAIGVVGRLCLQHVVG